MCIIDKINEHLEFNSGVSQVHHVVIVAARSLAMLA